MLTSRKSKRKEYPAVQLPLLWNRIALSQTDLYSLAILSMITLFVGWTQPITLLIGSIFGALAVSFRLFQKGMIFAFAYNLPIKPWHLASVVLALVAVGTHGAHLPAFAQFFTALEESITSIITDADIGIDESVITTIFVFFRVLIVLAFVIGVIIVFVQATRSNDWQPIANLLAIGVAFVIGVEVITALMLGEGTGAGGGAGGGG